MPDHDATELRQTVRVGAVALLLIAAFAALSGALEHGAVLALAGIGMLTATRAPPARPIRRQGVRAAA